MPWYYAGPEAKPVGPVSFDELHARRVSGVISPETYIIEHTGQPDESRVWRRYREVFPASPSLPSLPTVPPVPVTPPQQPPVPPHPLFPSAGPVPIHSPFPPAARPDPYYAARKANSWCTWGFWLSLASIFLLLACGLGAFVACLGIFFCVGGLIQVHKQPNQSGRGLAIAGLLISALTLLIALSVLLSMAIPAIKAREQTTTEQTPNDSE